jgi:hypothetical protein
MTPPARLIAILLFSAVTAAAQSAIGYGMLTGGSALSLNKGAKKTGKAAGQVFSRVGAATAASPQGAPLPRGQRHQDGSTYVVGSNGLMAAQAGDVRVLSVRWGDGETQQQQPASTASEASTALAAPLRSSAGSLPEVVRSGAAIEDLVAELGKPVLAVAGTGRDYDQRYFFKLPDGRRITVNARDGLVTSAIVAN